MAHVYVEQHCNYQSGNHQYGQNFNACTNASPASRIGTITSHLSAQLPKSKGSLLNMVNLWVQRSRQRKHLAQLDKHLLDDIGLSKENVAIEIAKPFWR